MTNDDNWEHYKKLVLKELDRNNSKLESIESRLGGIEERLAIVNTKIYVAAFVASAVITSMVQYGMDTI